MCVLSSTAGTQTQNRPQHASVGAAHIRYRQQCLAAMVIQMWHLHSVVVTDNVAELPLPQPVCDTEYSWAPCTTSSYSGPAKDVTHYTPLWF